MSYGSEGWSDYYGEPWMPGDGLGDADMMGALGPGDRGVVVAPSGLNLRAQPLPTAPIVGSLARGAVVEILGEGGAPVDDSSSPYRGAPWYMVRSGSAGGWLTGEWIGPASSGVPAPPAAPAAAIPPLMREDDEPRQPRRFPEEPPARPAPPPAAPPPGKKSAAWYESPAVKVGAAAALLAGVVYVGSKYL
jgi:hypothetical protein